MAPFANILQTIGRTPIVRVNRLFPSSVSAFVKLERANPGGSIKDRIALAMIEVRWVHDACGRVCGSRDTLHVRSKSTDRHSRRHNRTRSAAAC